jgi:uncharacterized protein YigE (DUF2233 family)
LKIPSSLTRRFSKSIRFGIQFETIRAFRPRSSSTRKFSALFLALAFGASAQAQWTFVSTQSEFSAAAHVEHRHAILRSTEGLSANLDLAIFSTKTATLRLIDNPGASGDLATTMGREACIAGTNGGYFDPEFAPVGLSISDGRVVRPLQKAKLLSGVVSANNGRVVIQRAAYFSIKSKPKMARQCGPFLIDGGKPLASLNAEREARRTFVATSSDRVMLGYCSSVTLAQLAEILSLPDWKIQRALNLDGGSSSAFWFAGDNGVVSIREQKSVRDFIAVVAK